MFKKCLAPVLFVLSCAAGASELRYQPVNPTFGGNPMNASGLQSAASAQNDTKAPEKTALTPLEKFTNNVEAAIISKLQTTTVNALFDSKGNFTPNIGKTLSAGNFTVEIKAGENNTLLLVTRDIISGASTSISINSFAGLE